MLLGIISAGRNLSCSPVRSGNLLGRSKSPISMTARSRSPLSGNSRSRSPMSIRSSRSTGRSGHSSLRSDVIGSNPQSLILSQERGLANSLSDMLSSMREMDLNRCNNNNNCESTDGDVTVGVPEVMYSRLLGTGGFGTVYAARLCGRNVAVKKLHKYTKNPRAKLQSFRAELRCLRLRHPNIVRTYGSTSQHNPDKGLIVMEYAGDKNLLQVIDNTAESLTLTRRLRFALDLARAISYVHSEHVVHLDVKPANIIITPRDTCKLGDFGCCQLVEEETGMVSPTHRTYLTGTFAYRAPECLKGEPPSTKSDVYSYGITLWQMLTREAPYRGENQHVVIFGVVANGMRPHVTSSLEEAAARSPAEAGYLTLLREAWRAEPGERPPAAALRDRLRTAVSTYCDVISPDCEVR